MGFVEAVTRGFQKYVAFSGRASRTEYWYWVLFNFVASMVSLFIDAFIFLNTELSPVNTLVTLVLFLPSLAVAFRRLHDIDRSAWWILIAFTLIGVVLLIYWACLKGTTGANQYGEDPLADADRTRW